MTTHMETTMDAISLTREQAEAALALQEESEAAFRQTIDVFPAGWARRGLRPESDFSFTKN